MPPTAPQPAHALESYPPLVSGAGSAGEAWEAATKAVEVDSGTVWGAAEEEEGPAPQPVPFTPEPLPFRPAAAAATAGKLVRAAADAGASNPEGPTPKPPIWSARDEAGDESGEGAATWGLVLRRPDIPREEEGRGRQRDRDCPVSATGESLTPDSVSVTECHSHENKGAAPRASVTRDVSILMGGKPRLFLASIGLIITRGPSTLALPMARLFMRKPTMGERLISDSVKYLSPGARLFSNSSPPF